MVSLLNKINNLTNNKYQMEIVSPKNDPKHFMLKIIKDKKIYMRPYNTVFDYEKILDEIKYGNFKDLGYCQDYSHFQ